jgi:hypothetical protein
MLHCDRADVAVAIYFQQRALIEVTRLDYWGSAKLDEQSICIGEVANFHGTNLRSKNAL